MKSEPLPSDTPVLIVQSKGKRKKKRRTKRRRPQFQIPRRGRPQVEDYSAYLLSDHWKAKRQEAFKYHGPACHECGATESLVVHHMTYRRLGREKMKDLRILCGPCHRLYHKDKPDDGWERTKYDDWPVADTGTAIVREYAPLLYGRPVGSGWPVTVEGAQRG